MNLDDVQFDPQQGFLTRVESLTSLFTDDEQRDQIPVPMRHEKYYIDSGDVVFQVESTLFRVHRYFFVRESPVFRDMLALPAPILSDIEGTSDERPIHLPQISRTEFENFLWVFYNPRYSHDDATVEVWTSILSLAHRWDFPEVRALAFRTLSEQKNLHVPPVTRLVLADKYDAPAHWRAQAISELGARKEPLTEEEGEQLGMATVIQVAKVREYFVGRIGWTGRDRTRADDDGYRTRAARHGRSWSRSSSRSNRGPVVPPPVMHPPSPVPVIPQFPPGHLPDTWYVPPGPALYTPYLTEAQLHDTYPNPSNWPQQPDNVKKRGRLSKIWKSIRK